MGTTTRRGDPTTRHPVVRGERLDSRWGDRDALSFTRRIGPNVVVGLLLLVFGVVPGLLYFLFAGSELTTTLLTIPAPGGTELEIIVNRRSDGGQAAAARFFNSLHELV